MIFIIGGAFLLGSPITPPSQNLRAALCVRTSGFPHKSFLRQTVPPPCAVALPKCCASHVSSWCYGTTRTAFARLPHRTCCDHRGRLLCHAPPGSRDRRVPPSCWHTAGGSAGIARRRGSARSPSTLGGGVSNSLGLPRWAGLPIGWMTGDAAAGGWVVEWARLTT